MTANKSFSVKGVRASKSDFIWKASKPRRWKTSVLKNHPDKIQNSGFFYVRRRRLEGFEVRE